MADQGPASCARNRLPAGGWPIGPGTRPGEIDDPIRCLHAPDRRRLRRIKCERSAAHRGRCAATWLAAC